jgi:formylglycine-generating enzyme required for sulfatase activity
VGSPNNAPDSTGLGTVGYSYNIGTYDVTNSQYVEFLNSNVPGGETADPLALYNSNMSNSTYGGITYNSGAASGSKYGVMGTNGQNPVNYVTFYDALRFANWLDNNQVAGMTETGAYTLLGNTPTPSNAATVTRNSGATVFLPSENEWYKASYYNPATSSYYQYPTSSNTAPNATGPTATPNSANYDNRVRTLTAVGAYTGTTSPYGAFDMGGDVFQWNDTMTGSARGVRGGAFSNDSTALHSSDWSSGPPSAEGTVFGFRVASVPTGWVPEPSSLTLAAVGFAGLAGWCWRGRNR